MSNSSVACLGAGSFSSVKVATGVSNGRTPKGEVLDMLTASKMAPSSLTQSLLVSAISRALLDQDPNLDLEGQFNHIISAASFLVDNVKTSGDLQAEA